MLEHPKYKALTKDLRSAAGSLSRSWEGAAFRCVAPKWSRPEFLASGLGAARHGSRWMRPGLSPAVYAASTENIALKESRGNLRHFGVRKPAKTPRMIVQIDLRLVKVVDLTRLEEALAWPSLDELLSEKWESLNAAGKETLSQAFGRALFTLGFTGLIAPSARDRAWTSARTRSRSAT